MVVRAKRPTKGSAAQMIYADAEPQRCAKGVAIRLLVAAAIGLAGCATLAATAGYALRNVAPELSLALAPGDGRVVAIVARNLAIKADGTAADRTRADQLAHDALRRDPTSIAALTTLGSSADLLGEKTHARALFAFAERLSRRDLVTQIWAIEDNSGRGDVAGALRHYDIALRTTADAPQILFPVLASAIIEPAIRDALVSKLEARPEWGTHFVSYVATGSGDPRAAVDLFLLLHRAAMPVDARATAAVIDRLIRAGYPDYAWRYYISLHPDGNPRRSRDPGFARGLENPTAFDWTGIDQEGAMVASGHDGVRGFVTLSASVAAGGPVLRQTQVLPPGRYRLSSRSSGIDQRSDQSPYWIVACAEGRELARIPLGGSGAAEGNAGGDFVVPVACTYQTLTLFVRPSSAGLQLSGEVDRALIEPAG